MLRILLLAGGIALAPVAFLSAAPAAAQSTGKCDNPVQKAKRSMFGSLLGNIGNSVLGRVGAPSQVISLAAPVTSYLGDELLKMLDCKEQQQAAKATEDAVRGGVGTEVSWTSESRANVSGVSRVTGQEQLADGGTCLTVTDVVIVDGEETTVPKKMCRAKGASAFAKA
ncbi:MAG TPA: hypothetical protein VIL42_07630 [Sphingomicrobium sp.]|jgi:hypothetical protein